MEKRGEKRKNKRVIILGAAFYVWRFRIVTAIILSLLMVVFNKLVSAVINLDGIAITSANLSQFLSWKTIIIVLLGILIVFLYFVFDILSQIYLCDDLITGTKPGIFRELARGFGSLKRFANPKGVILLVFILFAVPLVGIGFSVGLTENFYIPRFISSVMFSNKLIAFLYTLMLAFFLWLIFQWIFCFHAVLIDRVKPSEAVIRSKELVKANWKDILVRFLKILIISGLIYLLVYLLANVLPFSALNRWGDALPDPGDSVISIEAENLTEQEVEILTYRVISAFAVLFGRYIIYLAFTLIAGYFMVQLTRMYYEYTGRDSDVKKVKASKSKYAMYLLIFLAVPVVLLFSAFGTGNFYDSIFVKEEPVLITAHRTGGYLASENSLEGIDKSVEHGCYGGETDIQRTKDGHYIILHDNTFKRLTGVKKKPGDMTLKEIKELRIKDTTGSGDLLPVPTLEELLDRGKGRIKLFLELKGVSADRKMADDIVKAVRERDMVDDVILISLKYNVIDYIERTYPEFETGILIFVGIGDVSELNCDMIIMEEEMSTEYRIDEIHEVGKRAGVWTVDTKESMYHFLCSDADTVITDDILMAEAVQKELDERTELEVISDRLTLEL